MPDRRISKTALACNGLLAIILGEALIYVHDNIWPKASTRGEHIWSIIVNSVGIALILAVILLALSRKLKKSKRQG